MVKTHFTLAVAAMLSLSAHAASIHDNFPVTDSVTVKGQVADADFKVDMPFHTTGTTTMIVGTGNAKASTRFISGDFEPVIVPSCDGTASNMTYSAFYAQDVKTSPVGAYEETLVGVLVKRKGAPELALNCLDANPDNSTFLSHLLSTLGVLGGALAAVESWPLASRLGNAATSSSTISRPRSGRMSPMRMLDQRLGSSSARRLNSSVSPTVAPPFTSPPAIHITSAYEL